MKHGLFIFCMLISLCFPMAFSQQATTVIKPDLKYGKPSKEELSLFHKGKSGFTYNDKFELYTEHWVRIKILKPQGVSQADVAIPYYAPSDRDKEKDRISDLDGCSYNLENGKLVKTRFR